MKYRIDSQAIQQRALTLGRTSTEVALGAGISVDTIQAIYRQDIRQYTERIVLGLAKSLEMSVQDFATRI